MKNTFSFIHFLGTILCFHFNTPLEAQNPDCHHTLSGAVIDEHDQQPLPFATIYIEELQKGVVSDSLGSYQIEGICKGTYTVTASHIGCEPVTKKLHIQENTLQNFVTEHHEEILETIKVTGKKDQLAATMTKNSIKAKELEQMKGKSLGEALMKIAGVNSLQTGPTVSKPIIHGLHSNRILMLNNGVRQEGQQWGAEHAPEIDPFIAEKLTVIKGAASVQYGAGAIGGVVLVEPAPLPITGGLRGKVNLVGMSNGRQGIASAQLEGRLSKQGGLAWRLQGTLKKTGDFHTPNYSLTNTAMHEKNASAALGFKKYRYGIELFYSYFNTELGILRGSHIGNLPDLEAALEREIPLFTEDFNYDILNPKQQVSHHLAKMNAYWRSEKWGKLQLQYAFQFDNRKEFDIRRGNRSEIPSLDLDLQSQQLELNLEHKEWGQLKGRMGFS
ncbi:MAG: TonB-dependent receptor plug domain-containing protein, partial [Chitinophagales bacterium]